jgi:hypothetical protein
MFFKPMASKNPYQLPDLVWFEKVRIDQLMPFVKIASLSAVKTIVFIVFFSLQPYFDWQPFITLLSVLNSSLINGRLLPTE